MGTIDQFITKEHIRRTLSDGAVSKIHFKLGPIVINPGDYRNILTSIMNNHILLHYSMMDADTEASYDATHDLIELPIPSRGNFLTEYRRQYSLQRYEHPREPDRNREVTTELINRMMKSQEIRFAATHLEPYAEMTIIHECTHAIVDWFNFARNRIEIRRWETEAVAHIAENVYMLAKTNGLADIGDRNEVIVEIAHKIHRYGWYEVGTNRNDPTELQRIQQALSARDYQQLNEARVSNRIAPRSQPRRPSPRR